MRGPWNYLFWRGDALVDTKNIAESKLNDLTAAKWAITIRATRVEAVLDEQSGIRRCRREVWSEGQPMPMVFRADGTFR